MERREYLLKELPDELLYAYEHACMGLKMGTVGFTFRGVRYRIYRDEGQKAAAKAIGIDLLGALKGADVAAEGIEAAMDKIGMNAEARDVVLADITKANGKSAAQPETDTICR